MALEPIADDDYPRVEQLLQPLTPSELDMTEVLVYEHRHIVWMVNNYSDLFPETESTSWWEYVQSFFVYELLMQPNATQNLLIPGLHKTRRLFEQAVVATL